EKLRPVLCQEASNRGAQLIALPISRDIREPDHEVIRELVSGCENVVFEERRFDTPTELIRKVGKCRVVVTGAFHPAVFALGQGIPVIGLVKSQEYKIKFRGLYNEF